MTDTPLPKLSKEDYKEVEEAVSFARRYGEEELVREDIRKRRPDLLPYVELRLFPPVIPPEPETETPTPKRPRGRPRPERTPQTPQERGKYVPDCFRNEEEWLRHRKYPLFVSNLTALTITQRVRNVASPLIVVVVFASRLTVRVFA